MHGAQLAEVEHPVGLAAADVVEIQAAHCQGWESTRADGVVEIEELMCEGIDFVCEGELPFLPLRGLVIRTVLVGVFEEGDSAFQLYGWVCVGMCGRHGGGSQWRHSGGLRT